MSENESLSPNESRQSGLIRDLSDQDKPREKAMTNGIKSLTDVELMAIIFATGVRGKSVIELSREILADHGNHLSEVAKLSPKELTNRYKGIGLAKAITLLGALELGSRAELDAHTMVKRKITNSEFAYKQMCHRFDRLDHEEFWVMLLSQSGTVKKEVRIGVGGISATYVDVKLIMKSAIEYAANAMILCHNHPSGNLTPSVQDDELTKKVKRAAEFMDIRVNDHIIFSDSGYYSYADQGRL